MSSKIPAAGQLEQPFALPSNPEFWDGLDRADLVEECEGCGLAKGPIVSSSDLAGEPLDFEDSEVEDEIAPVDAEGDPWGHLNGQRELCICTFE